MNHLKPNQKTILIIEDEIDLRSLYSEILEEAGYIVEEAGDGDLGLDKIKNVSWNLLLLDIMLPGQDGLRILKEIKNNADLKKGPVIMLSNLNSEHIIQEAFKNGADGYLIKSEITPDTITNEVSDFLRGHVG